MSPISPVFYTEETVIIGLKASFRVGTSIPQIWRTRTKFQTKVHEPYVEHNGEQT